MIRTIAATFIAPLWAPVFAIVFVGLFFPASDEILKDVSQYERLLMAALIGLGIGYAAMLIIGLPTHAVLRKKGHCSLITYVVTWFILAIVLWAFVFVIGFAASGLPFAFSYLLETIVERAFVPLSFGASWALSAATFWLIVRPNEKMLAGRAG